MKLEIVVESNWGSIHELKRFLEGHDGWSITGINLEPILRVRGMDPTILVAVVGAAGAGLGALISGLLAVARQSKTKKVIIQGRQGSRLEIPVDTPPDKVDYWIDKLREIDADRIIV